MKKRFYILLLISFLLSLADVQAQQKATPKAGEGISTFLLRHNRAPKKYYDDFVELNKAKLGKGNVLKLGVTYTRDRRRLLKEQLRGEILLQKEKFQQRRLIKRPQQENNPQRFRK